MSNADLDAVPRHDDEPGPELRRLSALYDAGLLDGEAPAELRTLVHLAAGLLGCPDACLTLIDRDVQHGCIAIPVPLVPMPRPETICTVTIAGNGPLVIDDLTLDRRFAGLPVVTQGMRFYAGIPVHAPDADDVPQPIGALCVSDTVPRSVEPGQRETLTRLGALADTLIAARASARRAVLLATESDRMAARLARESRLFAQAERLTRIGSWRLTLADERVSWSDGVYRIYGLPLGTDPTLTDGLANYLPASRARVADCLQRAIETGEPFEFEEDFRSADGTLRRVRSVGEREDVDGVPVALIGVFQDVTDRYRLETELRQAADTDALTGLANRVGFERALEAAMARARQEGTPLTLAMLDLDGFKAINDTLGHTAGDDVLRAIGRALSSDAPVGTLAARLGGDEFAVVVENGQLCDAPDELRLRLEEALRVPVEASGGLLTAAGTVGLAVFGPEDRTVRDFVHRADAALYVGKRARIGERPVGKGRRAA